MKEFTITATQLYRLQSFEHVCILDVIRYVYTYNIPVLTLRFEYLYLLTFYKIVNSLVQIIDPNLLPEKLTSETRLAKSSGFRLSEENYRFALANFGAQKFNELTNHVKLSLNLATFKNATRSHDLKLLN
jgi:hypothetical protein